MLIFIITFARTGGMILCETIGQHPGLLTLNEKQNWREQIKDGKSAVIKIWNFEMFNPKEEKDIFDLFPDAKFISVLRDPKDLSASLKKLNDLGRNTKLFLTHSYKADHQAWIEAVVQYKEFLTWLEGHKENKNLMILKFEDLILKKHETFKEIFKWAGISMDIQVQNHINNFISNDPVKNYKGRAWSMSGKKKIGYFKEVLTAWEIKKINSIFPKSARVS